MRTIVSQEAGSVWDYLNRLLLSNQRTISVREFAKQGIGMGIAVAMVLSAAGILLKLNFFYITCLFLGGFFLPLASLVVREVLVFESRKHQKEDVVADLLLSASVFARGTPTPVLLRYCACSDFGLLSLEFERSLIEMERGASVKEALENISLRCQSRVVSRAINLIRLGYDTGSDLSETFRHTAEDLLETQSILRERNASMLVEKYTILFAGGFLVPVVLGLLTGMVSTLDFSGFGALEIGLDSATRSELRSFALLGTQIYLLEYGLLASFFVAAQEGNWKRGFAYAAILVPVGIAAFVLARGS